MNNHYKHHYNKSAPVVVVVHKLDSLYLFSDTIYTCDSNAGFAYFQLLTPNIMRVVITLNTLKMTVKITPGTFSGREIALATCFPSEIVLFPSGKRPGRAKQAHTPQHIIRDAQHEIAIDIVQIVLHTTHGGAITRRTKRWRY